ncbi:MAG: diacylglycerol/lipid kinase family protein [Terriglobales bacterium]
MRAAAIFGLNASEKDLRPFERNSGATWHVGLPANPNDTDAILIFGGDGTVHRYLPELVKLRRPVLMVPCGSGNDFARSLGLRRTRDALAAWKKFTSTGSNLRTIDLGVITSRSAVAPCEHYFCCVGGVGLDAEVARRANQLPRWLRAHGGYALRLLPAIFQFPPVSMKITYDGSPGHTQPTILAAFANAPAYGGGMKIAPRAQLDDGLLDLCILRALDPFKLLCLFPTIYFGKHLRVREFEYHQTPQLKIETAHPLDVYADGEYVCHTPVEVSVAPRVLAVITPSPETRNYP